MSYMKILAIAAEQRQKDMDYLSGKEVTTPAYIRDFYIHLEHWENDIESCNVSGDVAVVKFRNGRLDIWTRSELCDWTLHRVAWTKAK